MNLNLISNENDSLNLLKKIRARLNHPDLVQVDILISYIMKSGVDSLDVEFEALQERDVTVRIITTCQLGISDFEGAVERLAKLKRFEIKVFTKNYPTFHAKGWRFEHRNDASRDAIIVGSSNLSKPALKTGREFNIEVERGENDKAAKVITNFRARFDDYWQNTIDFVSITNDNLDDMRNKHFKKTAYDDCFLQGNPYKPEFEAIMQQMQQLPSLREKAKQWNETHGGERVNKHSRSKSVTDAEQDNVQRRRVVGPAVEYPVRDLEGLTMSTLPAASSSLGFEALPDQLIPPLAHSVLPAAAQPQVASITEAVTLIFNAAVQSSDIDDLNQILSKLDAREQATLLNIRQEWSLPFTLERAREDGCAHNVLTFPIWPALMRRNYQMLKVMLEKGALLAPITLYRPERDTRSTYHPLIILTSEMERDLDITGYGVEGDPYAIDFLSGIVYDEAMEGLGIAIMMIRCSDFDLGTAREVEEHTELGSPSPRGGGLIRETSALDRVQEVCRCCYSRDTEDGVVSCFYKHDVFFMIIAILLLEAGARPDPSRASCEFILEAGTQYKNMREGEPIELRDLRKGDNRVEKMLGRKVVRKVTESMGDPDQVYDHIFDKWQAESGLNRSVAMNGAVVASMSETGSHHTPERAAAIGSTPKTAQPGTAKTREDQRT
ncbi:hypothetical protein LTS16_001379 [Friedmanniomyces endolithicus]|nr:hypothetical protein LTS01_004090 [Friedmanniomyces endolithicus]KAK1052956.1 hypothetical protein LTS16_001379 [Friedmanniomyces endolithicus]